MFEYARRNPGTTAVLDDGAARRAALVLHIPLTGTLGLLVAPVNSKLLPSLLDAIDVVRSCGLHVDPVTASALMQEKRCARSSSSSDARRPGNLPPLTGPRVYPIR